MRESRVRTADQLRRTDAAAALQGGLWKTESTQNTFTDGQGNKFWLIDTSGGAVSVSLPAAADTSPDTLFTVKRTTGGANALTVTPDSGNIDGSAAHSIASQYAAFAYASDGSNYHIVRQYTPGEFVTSASLATVLAPYLTSASAALSTYLTSASAATALAAKQANILFKDEGASLSSAGNVTTVNFVGAAISASLTGGLLTVTAAAAGWTSLGSINTSSGAEASLGSLVLTSYRFLKLQFKGVSLATNLQAIRAGNSSADDVTVTQSLTNTSSYHGTIEIDLSDGVAVSNIGVAGSAGAVQIADTAITTASTTITLVPGSGNFDAGSVEVLAM